MAKTRAGKVAPAPRRDTAATVAAAALIATLGASALLVDLRADASFDAPKRLGALFGIALAAASAFAFPAVRGTLRRLTRSSSPAGRAALVLAAVAAGGAILSAVLSPRRGLSLDATRALALFALLLPLGASRAVARHGRVLLAVFLSLAAANAAISILQSRQVLRPFALETRGTRDATGALVGNVGYLSLVLGLAAVAALSVALTARRRSTRLLAAAALPLYLADLVVNQNLTSLSAAVAGAAVFLFARFGRRALLPAAAVLASVALAFAAYPQARLRASEVLQSVRTRDADRLLTYRFGPWGAALEMFRERPLLGFGPGTFEAEFVPHRLSAEIRARRRFVNPLATSSYGEAHSEPMQALAEGGLAGVAAIAAAAALLVALVRAARRSGPSRVEAELLLAVCVAGAVSALTWFPLQRPATSVPLLLAVGRGWRVAAESENTASPEADRRSG